MKTKNIFTLAVRLLGLVFVYHGLIALPVAVAAIATAFAGGHLLGLLTSIAMAGWPLFVAYWLLRGAPLIMSIAYPDVIDTKPEVPVEGSLARNV